MSRRFRDAQGTLLAIVYRDTRLGPSEFGSIQALIDAHPEEGAVGVTRLVCEHFDWRRPNGELAVSSSTVFLRQLEKQRLIRLPKPRMKRSRGHQDNDRAAMLEALGPVAGTVEHQPAGPLTVRPIAAEEYDGFRLHLRRYHYLGFSKPSGESLCYVALLGNELVALLVWGAAVLHNAHRDHYIGWDSATRERRLPWVVNNTRFLMLPWIRQPHLASRVLGANLRRLSRDFEATYGHSLHLAETFVDLARFRGTCYRASNWSYLGQTQGYLRTRRVPRGFVPNQHPKAVFVYLLHRRALERLKTDTPIERKASASPSATSHARST